MKKGFTKGFPNIIDKKKKLRNDDRYWRPRQEEIKVCSGDGITPEKWQDVFGYAYQFHGKRYDINWKEIKGDNNVVKKEKSKEK